MIFRTLAIAGLAFLAGPAWISPATADEAQIAPVGSPDAAGVAAAIAVRSRGALHAFYESRGFRPVWTDRDMIGSDAQMFLHYLEDASLDGLKPSRYRPAKLRTAIAQADSGDADAIARADIALSDAFARFVGDMRKPRKIPYEYADPALKPGKPDPQAILRVASLAPSFGHYIRSMGWMSPLYVRTRELLRAGIDRSAEPRMIDIIRLNLDRARLLPPPTVRHIEVDVASAQLWYYQAGKEAGKMRVVVGAPETQTPMMAGSLNYAILKPYWNVPDYLVRRNVAQKIISGRTLASMHMEVLSDWSATPARVDPATVDWASIAAGTIPMPRVRELPGPYNSMGQVKFVFPNDHGIYLHDTPNRDLLEKPDRHLSNGCIRLEKAWVLGEWMMGKTLAQQAKKAAPETPVPMAATVPVYLTYITVAPAGDGTPVLLPDVYGLDNGSKK